MEKLLYSANFEFGEVHYAHLKRCILFLKKSFEATHIFQVNDLDHSVWRAFEVHHVNGHEKNLNLWFQYVVVPVRVSELSNTYCVIIFCSSRHDCEFSET